MGVFRTIRGIHGLTLTVARLAILVAALCGAQIACALDAGLALSQLRHTSWTVEHGAPTTIVAMAQTADHLLWLGTPGGLYSFDGVTFTPHTHFGGVRPLSAYISALLAGRDGSLWFGFRYGGISRWDGRSLKNFGAQDGFAAGSVTSLAEGADGAVWAATTSNGLRRFAEGRWSDVWGGLPKGLVNRVLVDKRESVWVSMDAGIFRRTQGSDSFKLIVRRSLSHMALAPDGSVWVSGAGLPLIRIPADTPDPSVEPSVLLTPGGSGPMLFDKDGGLWLSMDVGVRRVRNPSKLSFAAPELSAEETESFTPEAGMSGKSAWSWFEDREGNVWIGTSGGLDRFRTPKLTALVMPPRALGFSLIRTADGGMMATDMDRPVVALTEKGTQPIEALPKRATATYRAADGTLWMGTMFGLFRVPPDGGAATAQALPSVVQDVVDQRKMAVHYQAIVEDRQGGLLVSMGRFGIFRLSTEGWSEWSGKEGRRTGAAVAMHTGERGTVWAGYADGTLFAFDPSGKPVPSMVPKDSIGITLAFCNASDGGLWIGGERGLFYLRDGQARLITGLDGEALRGASGIVETDTGDVWVNSINGVTRLSGPELKAAIASTVADVRVPSERFDWRDGLVGTAVQSYPLPTLALEGNGRLWIATNASLAWIDTARIRRNTVAAHAVVLGVRPTDATSPASVGDGSDGRTSSNITTLPKETRGIEISYTAGSLSVSERVQFRYRLDGVDVDWQSAATRRQAFYTNLHPGKYTFRVKAANEDGLWGEEAAPLAFDIPPQWFQTWWFQGLVVVAVLVLLSSLYLFRVRYLQGRLLEKIEVRAAERERIARELHDTLLQGSQSLVLGVQTVASRIPSADPARGHLESMLDSAERVIADARDSVQGLRAHSEFDGEVIESLKQVGDSLAHGSGTTFRVEADTAGMQFVDGVQWDLFLAVREALVNAFRHAEASCVTLSVQVEPQKLLIVVADNGKGIEPSVIERGGRQGHWGFAGMRERLAGIDGVVTMDSDEKGTEVSFALPKKVLIGELSGVARLMAGVGAWIRKLMPPAGGQG